MIPRTVHRVRLPGDLEPKCGRAGRHSEVIITEEAKRRLADGTLTSAVACGKCFRGWELAS